MLEMTVYLSSTRGSGPVGWLPYAYLCMYLETRIELTTMLILNFWLKTCLLFLLVYLDVLIHTNLVVSLHCRRHIGLEVHACRNTVQGRYLLADDRGMCLSLKSNEIKHTSTCNHEYAMLLSRLWKTIVYICLFLWTLMYDRCSKIDVQWDGLVYSVDLCAI